MNNVLLLSALIIMFCLAAISQPETKQNGLDQFSFLVGNWKGTFKGYPTARIPKAFESPATMTSKWGPQHAWLESEANTAIPGMGVYSAKVIVMYDRWSEKLESYVVNTFGNKGVYTGTIQGNKAVFVGKLSEVTQRVTYESVSSKEMHFLVEESHDNGATFQPHSEILWHRAD